MVRQQAQQQKLEREKQKQKEKEDQRRQEEEMRDVWDKGWIYWFLIDVCIEGSCKSAAGLLAFFSIFGETCLFILLSSFVGIGSVGSNAGAGLSKEQRYIDTSLIWWKETGKKANANSSRLKTSPDTQRQPILR
jgi:hypothetical protein